MKFNIEVEVDWLGEGGDLDVAVKQEIISGIVHKLSGGLVKEMTANASQAVQGKLETLAAETFERFMEQGITITDRWGDPIKENVMIRDLIKERLDKALTETVSKNNGTPSDYDAIPRYQYMINQRVNKAVAEMTKEVVAQVDAKIAAAINDQIKARLSESLLGKIDVDSIVKKTLEGLTK